MSSDTGGLSIDKKRNILTPPKSETRAKGAHACPERPSNSLHYPLMLPTQSNQRTRSCDMNTLQTPCPVVLSFSGISSPGKLELLIFCVNCVTLVTPFLRCHQAVYSDHIAYSLLAPKLGRPVACAAWARESIVRQLCLYLSITYGGLIINVARSNQLSAQVILSAQSRPPN